MDDPDGDRMLWVAGITDVPKWRSLAPEVVQPRQLPDGLLEVERPTGKTLYLIEVATYSDNRVPEQILDDLTLVYQSRRSLPEAIVFVLRPKGNVRVASSIEVRQGETVLSAKWKVVELWTLDARVLLATREPALMPWVPLANFTGDPEPLLRECRQVIDERAVASEVPNLLAVTSVFAGLTVADTKLIRQVFKETNMVLESPVLKEIIAEQNAERIHVGVIRALARRFGPVPDEVQAQIKLVTAESRLDELIYLAGSVPDLASFRLALGASQT
jgi:predicted transposase YdaD